MKIHDHRRFPRSNIPERVQKSPLELLKGESHKHWLELLGFKLFKRNNKNLANLAA